MLVSPRADAEDQRPLRILFCTLGYPPGPGGGAERQARLQAEELVRRGHSVTVVCPSAPGFGSEWLNGVEIRRLRWPHHWWQLRELTYLPVLAGFLARRVGNYDLVHVHIALRQADVAVVAARLHRRPVYVKVAGGGRDREISPTKSVARITRHVGILGADMVQAISAPIEEKLLERGVRPGNIVRIPNGLDTARWSASDAEDRVVARRALGLPLDTVLVLFAGRFSREKGLRDLLDAWAEMPRPGRAKLVVVGDQSGDIPEDSIEESDHVIVRGWSDDLAQYYRAADIFVLPSHVEGMSNALLEAMCSGLAVVATNVGAAPEMIRSGTNGSLLDPGDRASLATKLDEFIDDPELRAQVGAEAASTVRVRFAIEPVVTRIEGCYRQLIQRAAAPGVRRPS